MITIGVPAFNEEKNLNTTIGRVIEAIRLTNTLEYEIIIVNDGSIDQTQKIAEDLQKENNRIRVINNPKNMGLGFFIQVMIKESKYEKFCLVAGDGNITLRTLKNYILNANRADLIMVCVMNTENRLASRSAISSFYTFLYLLFFDVHVKYINGAVVFPTKLMRELEIRGKGYSFVAEVAVKLLLKGCSFYEMIGYIEPNKHMSSAMRIKNLIDVIKSFIYLLYEIKMKDKSIYSKKPIRIIEDD